MFNAHASHVLSAELLALLLSFLQNNCIVGGVIVIFCSSATTSVDPSINIQETIAFASVTQTCVAIQRDTGSNSIRANPNFATTGGMVFDPSAVCSFFTKELATSDVISRANNEVCSLVVTSVSSATRTIHTTIDRCEGLCRFLLHFVLNTT